MYCPAQDERRGILSGIRRGEGSMGLIQAIYMGWIWGFSMRMEEGITADITMKPCILERKQESHSEGQKIIFGICFRSASE